MCQDEIGMGLLGITVSICEDVEEVAMKVYTHRSRGLWCWSHTFYDGSGEILHCKMADGMYVANFSI
jgi:hypothetical protein